MAADTYRRAWKFLDERGRGMVTGHPWPVPAGPSQPGEWVEAGGPLEVCARVVHACRVDDLGWWLSAQLWEVELDGEGLVHDVAVLAERGRLVRRIDGWPQVGAELAQWAVWRTRDRAAEVLAAVGVDIGPLAGCRQIEDLPAIGAELTPVTDPGGALALALLLDNLADLPNPVTACHTSARAAGHAATVAGQAGAYEAAFAAERRAQGLWLAERLGLNR